MVFLISTFYVCTILRASKFLVVDAGIALLFAEAYVTHVAMLPQLQPRQGRVVTSKDTS